MGRVAGAGISTCYTGWVVLDGVSVVTTWLQGSSCVPVAQGGDCISREVKELGEITQLKVREEAVWTQACASLIITDRPGRIPGSREGNLFDSLADECDSEIEGEALVTS